MKLTNQQIYESANLINQHFHSCNIILPVRINFYLQKNFSAIINAANDIDKAKISIAKTYGKLQEESNSYQILPENIEIVNKELNDLFNLEQELNLHIFNINDFSNIELNYNQTKAILFMIEE